MKDCIFDVFKPGEDVHDKKCLKPLSMGHLKFENRCRCLQYLSFTSTTGMEVPFLNNGFIFYIIFYIFVFYFILFYLLESENVLINSMINWLPAFLLKTGVTDISNESLEE